MTNDSSSLVKADEAINFLVKQGILIEDLVLHGDPALACNNNYWHWSFLLLLYADLSSSKVRIKVESALAVERIESVAYSDGFQPEQLVNLVKLATSGKYG